MGSLGIVRQRCPALSYPSPSKYYYINTYMSCRMKENKLLKSTFTLLITFAQRGLRLNPFRANVQPKICTYHGASSLGKSKLDCKDFLGSTFTVISKSSVIKIYTDVFKLTDNIFLVWDLLLKEK